MNNKRGHDMWWIIQHYVWWTKFAITINKLDVFVKHYAPGDSKVAMQTFETWRKSLVTSSMQTYSIVLSLTIQNHELG